MTTQDRAPTSWAKLYISLRAVISGLLITLAAVNVWPLLLLNLGVPLATLVEALFLGLCLWWTGGGGPPRTTQAARAKAFRRGRLSPTQWFWGLVAALFFAATIHASIVLLFRLVSFPKAAFRHGYDVSFIPTQPLRWLVVVVSATSAGICEETGFRGYMQSPIEQRHGAPVAILISSLFFMALHLTKAWATPGMVPIVFGAGVLLGLLAWSSGSLIPGMIGHVVMDIGLFAYWWTGIAGDFAARTITETGVDRPFVIACATFTISLFMVLFAISRLRGRAQIADTGGEEQGHKGHMKTTPSPKFVTGRLSKGLRAATFLSVAIVVLAGGCDHPRSTPEDAIAASYEVLHTLIGKQVTIRGTFSLRGKFGPYVLLGNQQVVYLVPRGSFAWGVPYSEMEGKLVAATGTLSFYHSPDAEPADPAFARAPDYFYLEAETAQLRLISR